MFQKEEARGERTGLLSTYAALLGARGRIARLLALLQARFSSDLGGLGTELLPLLKLRLNDHIVSLRSLS